MIHIVNSVIEDLNKMDNEQLNEVAHAIKLRRNFIASHAVRQFVIGDRVEFSGKRGTVVGEIKKVNRKNLVVEDLNTMQSWRVPANMVKPAIGIGL
jgi:hypothetical protein